MKANLEREGSNLERGRIFPEDLIPELIAASESGFTVDLVKIQFDQDMETFREK